MVTYIKTAKGRLEAMSCRASLDLRLNSALLMVDGVTERDALVAALQAAGLPPDSLSVLEARGYIAPLVQRLPRGVLPDLPLAADAHCVAN